MRCSAAGSKRELIQLGMSLMQASAAGGASSRLAAFSNPAVERAQLQHLPSPVAKHYREARRLHILCSCMRCNKGFP
jgi:hypothetical protein